MNYSKLVKIIPLLDSENDCEALAALRALQRALLPESFGDVARLIEASLTVEPAPVESKPFTGFKQTAAQQRSANQQRNYSHAPSPPPPPRGLKPEKPQGEGWIWDEFVWRWHQVPKPQVTRFQNFVWAEPNWIPLTNYPAVQAATMAVMNNKLNRRDKHFCEKLFLDAMTEAPISVYDLVRLEQFERTYANV